MHHFGATVFAPASANSTRAFIPLGWPEKVKNWWNDFVSSIEWKTAAPSFAAYALLVAVLSIGYYWIFSNPEMAHKLPGHMDRPSAMLPESRQIADLTRLQPPDWSIAETMQTNPELFNRLIEVQPLYKNYNHFLAAEKLAEIVNDYPESIEANFYLGISQLRIAQPVEAIASFHNVLGLNPEHEAAQWYLAQGYLMESNVAEAQNWLTVLADKHNSQYGQSAIQLLKAIDKIQSQHK
jgi:hypothetical protein